VEGARAGFAFDAEAARGEAAHAQAERAMREERVRLMGSELETLHARIEGLQVELTALKVKVASVTERGEAARLRVESLALQAAELSARLQAREHARLEDLERVAILEGKLRVSAEALPARVEAIEGARREAEALREAHAQLTRTVSEAERAFKELRSLVDTLAAGRAEAAIKDRELELELDHLTAQVQERHQVTMAETLVLRQPAPVPDETSAQTLEELKLAVDRLGEVNLTAIEEHRELSERHRFLSGQQRDLDQSLDRLARAIEKIDATSRARFQETFDIVNQKFQHVFPRLFGGGRASLTLVQGAAGEEPGVEILAQPPGKKLQSVNLFSGGEKALTAVALIFAIFLIKPTPFCLLDEVDAPLDEGNVGRYNEMVREMSQGSQFILITHNKRTMEVVDALYGVTMEEPGVSKLVSVKLKDATAANTDQQVA
jgi:chromosome segregation protein